MANPSINQKPMPISIPQPGKLPELEPINEPSNPQKFPEENPQQQPLILPIESPPYLLPKPEEFP
jgi:hypothetical protein